MRHNIKLLFAILGGIGVSLLALGVIASAWRNWGEPIVLYLGLIVGVAALAVIYKWKRKGEAGIGPFEVNVLVLPGVAFALLGVWLLIMWLFVLPLWFADR